MNSLFRLLHIYLPVFIKKRKLEELFILTAHAFECEVPPTKHLTYEQCLHEYAVFTKLQTEKYLKDPINIYKLKERLYQAAYKLGRELRKDFGIANRDEVISVMKVIYNMLGIDLRTSSEKEINIPKCYFSSYYSPEICKVISSLDEGIAAGLSGGRNLRFYQRITEGHSCCRATFLYKEGC